MFCVRVSAFIEVLLFGSAHVGGMGLVGLSFIVGGMLLGLSQTSLIPYTRAYGLCRGRYSDIFIKFVWCCCVIMILICFLSINLMLVTLW